jgi:hypothetical protein
MVNEQQYEQECEVIPRNPHISRIKWYIMKFRRTIEYIENRTLKSEKGKWCQDDRTKFAERSAMAKRLTN